MNEKINAKEYVEFANSTASGPSCDVDLFLTRVRELKTNGCDVTKLITGAMGLSAESGEFMEIVRKFYGKVSHIMKIILNILKLN